MCVLGFPGGSALNNPPVNEEDKGLIPELGRSFRERNGNPLHYYCLENPMYRGARWATVQGLQRVRHDLAIKQQQQMCVSGRSIEATRCTHMKSLSSK